ncbi:MAG: hypothetical protein ACOYXR_10370 [Nitrospirota bacterium]
MTDDEPEITPRADARRALIQAIERVAEAIERGRAAADHADEAFGNLSLPSLELADLIGTLRVWYTAACDLLEEIDGYLDRPGEQDGVQSPKTPRTTNPGDPR